MSRISGPFLAASSIAAVLAVLALGGGPATSGELPLDRGRAPGGVASPRAPEGPAARYFTDVALVNQQGRELRLYSDLLQGRCVIVTAFFTSCDGACPALMSKLQRIQNWLGDRLGEEALILSISVDPETDTVDRVRDYAKGVGARPGWHFLTGDPERVSLALRKVGQYVADPQAHTNVLIVGNEPTGLWKKAFGLSPSEELIEVVESVLQDRL